ncbi:MAG: STAS domain-containing protein [Planctomycetales bacterium]|nr:STAS domain-containing protein [Planctomycetales bacterium]
MSLEDYFSLSEDTGLVIQFKCRGGAFAEEASRSVWPELLGHVESYGKDVVLDLSALKFFGSTVLDLIATINKTVHKLDRRVLLAGVSATGREVLEIARFDQFLDIFETAADALGTLADG